MNSEEPTLPTDTKESILDVTNIKKEREESSVLQGSQATTSKPEDTVKIELRHAIQSRRVAQGLPLKILEKESDVHDDDELNPEEQLKKQLRRERNRIAAIRCREKRKARLNSLRKEADSLEQQNNNLEEDIALLKVEKDRLSLVLDAHDCFMPERLRIEHVPKPRTTKDLTRDEHERSVS